MAKRRDPELLAKISMMQRELQSLVELFHEGVDDPNQPAVPAIRQPLDTDLIQRVRVMVTDKPMPLADIVSTTEQTENKIKAVLTKMQRDGELLVNLGEANKALWYLFAPKVAARVLDRLVKLGVRAAADV